MKVEFHSGVADKLGSACGFLRSAHAAGATVQVCGDRATLDRLDQALWTSEPLSFVPHVRVRPGQAGAVRVLRRTPIRLTETVAGPASGGLLVNLGPDLAEHWESFDRVVEIVSSEPADAAAGRVRWRLYAQRSDIELLHHTRTPSR